MLSSNCSILTLAPYRIIPVTAGGHAGIVYMHDYLGRLCPDHVVSTRDNDEQYNYAFDLHRIFSPGPERYIPFRYKLQLLSIAKTYDVTYIMCEHPYMALSAMMLSRRLRIPWFLRSHNIEAERFKGFGKKWWKLLAKYERFAMQHAKGVLFVTREDADWAINNYELNSQNCHVIPFGTLLSEAPAGHMEDKQTLAADLQLDPSVPWLYFLGALDYKPNEEAVSYIINEIVPRLKNAGAKYQLLIAGKGLSEDLQRQLEQIPQARYLGFIPKIETLLNACDIMLNPVLLGGGIKTKAVEALAYNKIVVSSFSGAAGLIPDVCGYNLLISSDNDWDVFTQHILNAFQQQAEVPGTFYETYYWGSIAQKVISIFSNSI